MATLYIVGTPIGNLEDVSLRCMRILSEVDALACEDTRVTRKIFSRHEMERPSTIFSCHEHNETRATKRIIGLLDTGKDVALCTDSGLPSISDPGFEAVREAIEGGHDVDVIPGPSAAQTALIISGLPTSSYVFKGFPPRKEGQRKRFLEEELDSKHTLVMFESPYRLGKLLRDAHLVLGDRRCAVCVELTKKFQEIHRGYLSEIAPQFEDTRVKGEVTVVIAGKHKKFMRAEASSE